MRYRTIERIILVGGALVIILVFIGLIYGIATSERMPCEDFKNTSQKNLPARCIKYYQGVTE